MDEKERKYSTQQFRYICFWPLWQSDVMNSEGSQLLATRSPNETLRPAPRPAYFDADRGVWVFSRFADVSAALLQPQLRMVGSNSEGETDAGDATAKNRSRSEVVAALQARVAEWRSEFVPVAEEIVASLPKGRLIDVVGEFARPWSLLLAARVVGIGSYKAQLLDPLAARMTASTADPDDAVLKADAAVAGAELDEAVVDSRLPMAGPAFIAMSQTLPCLLANAWLILLRHPEDLDQIRASADLLPKAVEELLRLAGLARVVHRRAVARVQIGDALIERGQQVNLMIEIANHDPEQFARPDQMDLSRRGTGHFALGAGDHSCAAASLIRMAVGLATGVFVSKFVRAQQADAVEWRGGSGFRWPAAVYALRHPD
jgi:hypothetical protein